jgi:HSP20 family protein
MANIPLDVKKAAAPVPAASTFPDAWKAFRQEIDRLFDRFDGGITFPSMRRMFDVEPFWRAEAPFGANLPAVDVSEDDKAFTITAELPGLDEKDVAVSVADDMLTLKGEKRQEKDEKDKGYHLSERSYGLFRRSFHLPEGVDQEKIAANFAKGVLTLTLPKSEKAQKKEKKIEIKAA